MHGLTRRGYRWCDGRFYIYRNFTNCLGNGADVYLSSAERRRLPRAGPSADVEGVFAGYGAVNQTAVDTYRYLNFKRLSEHTDKTDQVIFQTAI